VDAGDPGEELSRVEVSGVQPPHGRRAVPLSGREVHLDVCAGYQFCLAYMQLSGIGEVSAMAHLGGAVVGVAAWVVFRRC